MWQCSIAKCEYLLIKYVCFHRFIPSRKYGDYSQPYPVASSYHYDPLPPPPTFSSPTDPTHPHTTPSLQVLQPLLKDQPIFALLLPSLSTGQENTYPATPAWHRFTQSRRTTPTQVGKYSKSKDKILPTRWIPPICLQIFDKCLWPIDDYHSHAAFLPHARDIREAQAGMQVSFQIWFKKLEDGSS